MRSDTRIRRVILVVLDGLRADLVGRGELAALERLCARAAWSLIFMHWPDADRAGHEHGWGSAPYLSAARTLDRTLQRLLDEPALGADDGTLLIACSDHGGGGVRENDHESDHPLDTTIPIVLAGAGVRPGRLGTASLIDLPATVLWALGIPVPDVYEGRVLIEAFDARAAAA